MIFCGDTVFPDNFYDSILANCDKTFLEKEKIVNLESLISVQSNKKTTQGIALSS
jgi:hypothetical protein